MNWLRYALIAGICAVSYSLFLEWNAFEEKTIAAKEVKEETLSSHHEELSVSSMDPSSNVPTINSSLDNSSLDNSSVDNSSVDDNDVPTIPNKAANSPRPKVKQSVSSQLIEVKTDSLEVLIDTYGGDIVKTALPKHLAKIDKPEPFILMDRTDSKTYVARSGLIGNNGTHKPNIDRPTYSTSASRYSLSENDDSLNVDLVLQQGDVQIIKRYIFEHNSYLIKLEYIVNNNSNEVWSAAPYGQIRRTEFDVDSKVGFGMQPFLGAAFTTDEENYKKYDFDDIEDADKEIAIKDKTGGWISMVQHYFISAWVPDQEEQNAYLMKKLKNGVFIFQYVGPVQTVEPGNSAVISSAFYAGPKNIKTLEAISPYLDLTLDYSWLWFIAKPLFFTLDFIHSFVGNWGVAIILLTCLIKLVFFYPSAMSYRSMAKMRKLQPLMAELKERYGDDKQKMSSELMKTYKKEGVNPLGGCLPILMQMPVFISLYWVLMESVELRHAPFFLWITDLSIKDPFFILPLIMGATMFIQQKLNPAPQDPMQAKVMQLMPIFFTVLFLTFPAGLVLYWVVNNTLSITQQYIITRQIEKASD